MPAKIMVAMLNISLMYVHFIILMLVWLCLLRYIWRMKNILRGIFCVVVCILAVPGLVGAEEDYASGDINGVGDLVISAVNTGYTADEVQQNYDFVELYNTTGEPVELAGWRLEYINSVGNVAGVMDFDGGAVLNAEYLVLGFAKSPQFAGADERYLYDFGSAAGLASNAGVLRLYEGDVLADEVCWGSAVCGQNFIKFQTAKTENVSVKRCIVDGIIEQCADGRDFEFAKYYPEINEGALYFEAAQKPEVILQCVGLVFSEIYSYFERDYGEQFVEIFNSTEELIVLDGCGVGYKNRVYELAGEIEPGEYLAYRNAELLLTKNPSSNNEMVLVDVDGSVTASMKYYYGQKRGTSWAYFVDDAGAGEWRQTYAVTAGAENIHQEFRSCAAGKIINPQTGNCINFFEEERLLACPVGKFRNPETNRCRSYESIDNILKPCGDGYFRSPETNRCRKVASDVNEVKPCADGYERNPETNRCRKVRVNNGADYGVVKSNAGVGSAWIGYGALIVVVAIGVGYVGWQFRDEIKRGMMKVVKKVARRE